MNLLNQFIIEGFVKSVDYDKKSFVIEHKRFIQNEEHTFTFTVKTCPTIDVGSWEKKRVRVVGTMYPNYLSAEFIEVKQ